VVSRVRGKSACGCRQVFRTQALLLGAFAEAIGDGITGRLAQKRR